MREQTYTDAFKENGAIIDKNLCYREIGLVPETAARFIRVIMHPDYSHISERNNRMYVYYHKSGSPTGVDLKDTFPMSCMAMYKELKNEPFFDLSAYSHLVEGW